MGRKLIKIFDKYINVLIILCLFIFCFSIGTADEKQDKYREFTDKFMQYEMRENNIPGVAVVIIQNGEIVFSKGYGYGNVENQTNLSAEDSVFRVASIAKLITAAAVMKLAEEGKIDLDAPVNDYLKRFKISDKGYKEPVRVRHLLTHTEGFTQKSIGGKTLDYTKLQDLGRFVERTMPKRFIEPGVIITYGNHASALLGVLIEDVTGETYSEYVKKEIFSPLGMNDSSFKQPVPENIRNKK
ncbi:serine hydrolase [Sebaldella sp. S0638]|uniref:serine hydrolase domain-containing protein n=1 Tax=Sebaldella sp. S0638 TaxID=2957809 RepID=UPI00209ECB6A|nr:serine hydrolase domain-containing protein [Sebaldella sp. S0638]MCP1224456.1 beta-lactamase family protein [Sebaldella sp. S0638]